MTLIDTASRQTTRIPLPNGSTALRGVAISPDGRYAYVTHTLGRFHLPTTQLDRGWMNTNALSIVDLAAGKLLNTVLLDSIDLGAANPWGVACTADGRWLAVAHSGSHELSVIDRPALHDRLGRVARGEKVTEASATADAVPNDLSFVHPSANGCNLDGSGPRAVAVAGDRRGDRCFIFRHLHWLTPPAEGAAPGNAPQRCARHRRRRRCGSARCLFNDAQHLFPALAKLRHLPPGRPRGRA